jgi:cell division protein FtsW
MIFNTSSAEVIDLALDCDTHQALFRQIRYTVVGGILAYGLYLLGYRGLLALSFPLLLFSTFLLLLTFAPGIGKQVNGACRWIRIAGYSIQPSEFAKLMIPIYFIQHMQEWKAAPLSSQSLWRLLPALGLPVLLIGIEPDNATIAIIGLVLWVLCALHCLAPKYWAWPLLLLLFFGGIAAYQLPYVSARLQVYMHPELDLRGKGHQPHQARIAAGSGQLFGKGPGQSLQKLSYLPEAQNDYIAAIYGEEFGFLGILFLILLYMLFTYTGVHIAACARDEGGFYLAAILTFLISIQAFLNLGVVSGLLPSTGLNLPFFSQGGSSLIANILILAILLSVWKEARAPLRKSTKAVLAGSTK